MAGSLRIAQAEALLAAFDWDVEHCRHVRDLAVALFDQLQPLHELGREDRDILEAAALLHDIGWTVSHMKHHKHSYRLIRENEHKLIGFPPAQIELIANVARYHRKSSPTLAHDAYANMSRADQQVVRRLAALLRLADGLDRPHRQGVQTLCCFVSEQRTVIHVGAADDWAAHVSGAERKRDLFEREFSRAVEFVPAAVPARVTPQRERR